MEFVFDDNKPIYKQLIEQLMIKIIIGIYPMGSKIPSVRELAMLTKVNPNTVQRALNELEEKKLIITKRTNGKFVTEDEKIIKDMKKCILKETVDNFINSMNKLNITKEDIISYLKEN